MGREKGRSPEEKIEWGIDFKCFSAVGFIATRYISMTRAEAVAQKYASPRDQGG